MRVTRHRAARGLAGPDWVLAVGRFDGVHLGHRGILDELRATAARMGASPVVALRVGDHVVPALTSLRRTLGLLDAAGVNQVMLLPRNDRRSAAAVARALGVASVIDGDALEREAGAQSPRGADLDREPVTSARLRALVASGDLDGARRGLGRWHAVDGLVVHGFHRGAPLGIPTANLSVRGIVLPPDGVYAVGAAVGQARLRGVANIGFNPTFGNAVRTVETHLLDFEGDLYGQRLEVAFRRRLRGEQRFPTVEALLAQIHRDVAAARALFDGVDG